MSAISNSPASAESEAVRGSARRILSDAQGRLGAVRLIKTAVHVAVALVAYLVAYQLVMEPAAAWWRSEAAHHVWRLAGLYALLAAAVEALFRTERASWRYVSPQDAVRLVRSTALTAVAFLLAIFLVSRADGVPRSVLMFAWVLHLSGLASVRLLRRLTHERTLLRTLSPVLDRRGRTGRPLLLVGDIGAADAFLRELLREAEPEYEAVGILALNGGHRGQVIRGTPVIGDVDDLERAIAARDGRRPVSAVLFLSPPDVLGDIAPDVLGRLKARQLKLLRLPAVTELSSALGALPSALRELSVEELLARPTVRLNLEPIHGLLNGKRVLVTGAGGSIGSEICRQVAAFGCARLALLDHSEFGLFNIDQEIAAAHPRLSRREIICDVRDRARVRDCLAAEAPDIVFHAAALKHVPIVENHPTEGVLTNVVGTWNVAEAARAAGAAQMVMISTDKAVDPANVMGATKRLAEAVVRGLHCPAHGPAHGRDNATTFSVVRFGNVLGSAGSVAPIFEAQIRRGGPVTVTHPDVERYFMTIPEAVQLVLHASAESASRDLSQPSVFVLDMGRPVKIVDLARTMISLHGLRPDVDIPIAYTGLRPGEKLTEALVDSSERVLARLESVTEVTDHGVSALLTAAQVQALEALARSGEERRTRQAVYDHVARLRGVSVEEAAG